MCLMSVSVLDICLYMNNVVTDELRADFKCSVPIKFVVTIKHPFFLTQLNSSFSSKNYGKLSNKIFGEKRKVILCMCRLLEIKPRKRPCFFKVSNKCLTWKYPTYAAS